MQFEGWNDCHGEGGNNEPRGQRDWFGFQDGLHERKVHDGDVDQERRQCSRQENRTSQR